jgi:hypothetical protein
MNFMKLTIAFFLVFQLFGCSANPSITLTARQEGSDLVFDIKKRGITGLLALAIWQMDPAEYFWKVNLDYYNESTLIYGHIPSRFRTFNGGVNSARQEFPPAGIKPRALTPNKLFCIALTWQYAGLTESGGTLYMGLR